MVSFNVKWDTFTRFMTIFTLVVYAALCIFMFPHSQTFWGRIVLYLLPILLVPCLFFAPNRIVLEENQLTLCKLIGTFSIKLDQIADAGIYNEKELNLRLFGSGGFLGYMGIFRNKSLGTYIAYVGDYSQAFWIRTKNGKRYMFSCEDRDRLLSNLIAYKNNVPPSFPRQ